MNRFQVALLCLAVIALASAAWMLRFEVVPTETTAYRLDRWTGRVEWLAREESYLVTPKAADGTPRQ